MYYFIKNAANLLRVLPTVEENLPTIFLRTHGEVDPVRRATLLVDQLVQFPSVLIGRIYQDAGIAYHQEKAQFSSVDS
jgi:hypothetical protein